MVQRDSVSFCRLANRSARTRALVTTTGNNDTNVAGYESDADQQSSAYRSSQPTTALHFPIRATECPFQQRQYQQRRRAGLTGGRTSDPAPMPDRLRLQTAGVTLKAVEVANLEERVGALEAVLKGRDKR